MGPDFSSQLDTILRKIPWIMEVLYILRNHKADTLYLGAGSIRSSVWNHLHCLPNNTPISDVDIIYFDSSDISREKDEKLTNELISQAPQYVWDVVNQAGVHKWYSQEFGFEITPIDSLVDGVSRWPETATAVAIKLNDQNTLDVISPYGLEDLFSMVVRRSPKFPSKAIFEKRLREKRFKKTWPKSNY